jgi:hypothetical protein
MDADRLPAARDGDRAPVALVVEAEIPGSEKF